jgi:hypothetical protein
MTFRFTTTALTITSLVIPIARMSADSVQNVARGNIRVGGKTIQLRYAAAVAELPGLFNPNRSEDKDRFELFVTDRPITQAEALCPELIEKNVAQGKLHGLSFTMGLKPLPHTQDLKPFPPRVTILYSSCHYSVFSDESFGRYRFSIRKLNRNSVSLRAWTPKELVLEMPDLPATRVQYDITASSTVQRPAGITKVLTGAAAQHSGPVAALNSYARAVSARNFALAARLCATGTGVLFAGPEGTAYRELERRDIWNPAKLHVVRVELRGMVALVEADTADRDVVYKCVLEKGGWRVVPQ